jgi:hypothetical protein
MSNESHGQSERDTHFAGAATLLYPDLKRLFTAYYEHKFFENEKGMEQVVEQIKTLIAQFLYDFAGHVAESLDPLHPGVDSAYVAMLAKTVESIPDIPDLTARPPTRTEQ